MRVEYYEHPSGSVYFPTSSFFRRIVYDDNNQIIEHETNWGANGTHYKRIDGVWTCLKEYKPIIVKPRTRKHNFWDK
ncbi:MAG: hypothetical protein EBS55_13495 [Flavobacteriaceae bacterium]|nr:hypothetical protein [Flavobacteriaceae bacterium]